jgi:alpha-galactosidase
MVHKWETLVIEKLMSYGCVIDSHTAGSTSRRSPGPRRYVPIYCCSYIPPKLRELTSEAITVTGTNFTLTGDNVSYLFHVDPISLDLTSNHFGGPVNDFIPVSHVSGNGWVSGQYGNARREFPDIGRGDFRLPAIHVRHSNGSTVSAFLYQSHEVVEGKPALRGLPSTYGESGDVTTLNVRLYDNYSDVAAVLSYSIFPKYNAIARSFQISNNGSNELVIERAASFSIDLPNIDLDMIEVQGDWAHEFNRVLRKIDYGETR